MCTFGARNQIGHRLDGSVGPSSRCPAGQTGRKRRGERLSRPPLQSARCFTPPTDAHPELVLIGCAQPGDSHRSPQSESPGWRRPRCAGGPGSGQKGKRGFAKERIEIRHTAQPSWGPRGPAADAVGLL
jgi:hypothetical protein